MDLVLLQNRQQVQDCPVLISDIVYTFKNISLLKLTAMTFDLLDKLC